MAENDNINEDGGAIPEPVVFVDGKQVPISQAQDALKLKEAQMQSGFQKILNDERLKIKQEQEKMQTALNEDTAWYQSHPPETWGMYEAKVNGGKGFIGDPKMLDNVNIKHPANTYSVNANPETTVFSDSTKVKSLEQQVKDMQNTLATMKLKSDEQGKQNVVDTLTSLKGKYPNADIEAVGIELTNYNLTHGEHPSAGYVESVLSKSNKKILEIINKSKSGEPNTGTSKPNIPNVKGGSAPDTKPNIKIPKLGSPDFVKYASEYIEKGIG